MGLENEDHLMVNIRLMKITGVYQLLSPHIPKTYGLNIFRCITIVLIMALLTVALWLFMHAYYYHDIYQVMQYSTYISTSLAATLKMYYIIRHSEKIWNCIQLTSMHFLSYEHHDRQILETGRTKSKSISTIFTILWLNVVACWLLSPLVLNTYYIEVKVKNHVYNYRSNTLNLIFPVSDKFYNEHFMTYYYVESIATMFWGYGTFIFDIILISMCITFSYQLKTIGNSYDTFGFLHHHMMNNKSETVEHNESVLINDFKCLLRDQQKVIENMRNSYKIFRPVTLLQIFADTMTCICLSSIAIMNYLNGMALMSTQNFRFIMGSSSFMFHLYCISALFSFIDEQKDSITFAMYCSNWTAMSLRFKKLLLYAMRMDSAENLNLQLTRERVVNFEMFTNIVRATYSILSMLVKKYGRTS